MIEIYPGWLVNSRKLAAVCVDKQEYLTRVIILMEKVLDKGLSIT